MPNYPNDPLNNFPLRPRPNQNLPAKPIAKASNPEAVPVAVAAVDVTSPAAAPATSDEEELTHCPHCRHRLLTVRSVLCNWCGQPIKDEKYLARAAAERAAADEALRQKIKIETEETAKFGVVGRLRRKAKTIKSERKL